MHYGCNLPVKSNDESKGIFKFFDDAYNNFVYTCIFLRSNGYVEKTITNAFVLKQRRGCSIYMFCLCWVKLLSADVLSVMYCAH